ncbi:hypothetical protein N7497_000158 [Penicillium chrysogenum]|nr:hypothetical protein N7524_001767 [Penicillium chrysogenum]KAJ6167315.1 hypothetical protein N7497_000158 [Penicillium chrysogenum]
MEDSILVVALNLLEEMLEPNPRYRICVADALAHEPDAAKATSKLAGFFLNPGPKHLDAIDRVIQFLYQTRYYALEYGAQMNGEVGDEGKGTSAGKYPGI